MWLSILLSVFYCVLKFVLMLMGTSFQFGNITNKASVNGCVCVFSILLLYLSSEPRNKSATER